MLPKMYNSRMDVDPDYVPEFTDWYKRRHGPDVVSVGMYSAHGYQAVVGSPWICNFYEIPGAEIFNEAYDRTRMADQQLDVIVAQKIFNHSLMIYEQVLTEGIPDSVHDDPHRPSLAGTVIGPAVTTIRFDLPVTERHRLLEWYRAEEFPRLRGVAGFFRGRVGFEEGKHTVYPGSEPEIMVMLEWGSVAHAMAEGDADDVIGRHQEAMGPGLTRASYHVVRHEYSLRHPDSWVA